MSQPQRQNNVPTAVTAPWLPVLALLLLAVLGAAAGALLAWRQGDTNLLILFIIILLGGGLAVVLLRTRVTQLVRGQRAEAGAAGPGGMHSMIAELHELNDTLGGGAQNLIEQAEYIDRQTQTLEILYDAASGTDGLANLDQLLERFLQVLLQLSGARAGIARVREEDGTMRLVACSGLCDEFIQTQLRLDEAQCIRGEEVCNGLYLEKDLSWLLGHAPRTDAFLRQAVMLVIPIIYHEQRLGAYNLFIDNRDIAQRNELCALLASIGRHLGIAMERTRLEAHARRLSIIEERTLLANELHDSLAQSLASLRFQLGMLLETIEESRDRTGLNQVRMIKDGLDQANAQLRELLSHFRTRMDERGLVPAIEQIVDRFRHQTGLAVFFQNELQRTDLAPAMEVQVLHIVQEALTNVRKHSDAQNVRVLLRSNDKGEFSILVEDDGQGIDPRDIAAEPGEHIGLTIMKERAAAIDGELVIESEAGEGTRVELNFRLGEGRVSYA